ncbi:hypothetical protein [Pseudonocardia sp.]|uniref:hypothetical protein n=1 Tax=Pseudonocardia sp. TaxID=60912 RepID=UPI003D0FAB09
MTREDPERKGRYMYPYGDVEKVHHCGLLAAESRAGQRTYHDIASRGGPPAWHGRGAAAEAVAAGRYAAGTGR